MRYFRFSSALLVTCLFLLVLPQRATAQQQESIPVTFTQYTLVDRGSFWLNCHSRMVGSHDDPVGNGDDNDYTYTGSGIYYGEPPEWTGVHEDIPGVRITYLAGKRSSSSPDPDGEKNCDGKFASHAAAWVGASAMAHYTPPPNEPPTACFTVEEGNEPLTIDFDASCSEDEDGEVVSYEWDFGGDGTGGGGEQPSFTYDERGAYEVTLTVRDDDGDESDPVSRDVEARGPDLRYVVSLAQQRDEAGKLSQDDDPAFEVGDTVVVRITVENTGDWRLEDVQLPEGMASIIVEPEGALAFVRGEQEVLAGLEPSDADTLVYLYEAASAVDFTVSVFGVTTEAVHPDTGNRVTYSETETSCTFAEEGSAKGGPFQDDPQTNVTCTDGKNNLSALVVNSTGDAPRGEDADGNILEGCDTGRKEKITMRDGSERAECTLRAALEVANASTAESVTIDFDIPDDDAGCTASIGCTITLGKALPPLSQSMKIDGTTQPGYLPTEDGIGYPFVQLAGATFPVFLIESDNVEVRGLIIQQGIRVIADHAIIRNNYIGSGDAAVVTEEGIVLRDAAHTLIEKNLISGNAFYGILVASEASVDNIIRDNYIGTNRSATAAIGNLVGILFINVPDVGESIVQNNIIAGNQEEGIRLTRSNGLTITGNYIGLDGSGTNSLPNGGAGIAIVESANTKVTENFVSGGSTVCAIMVDQGSLIGDDLDTGNVIFHNALGMDAPTATKVVGRGCISVDDSEGTTIEDNWAEMISIASSDRSEVLGNQIGVQRNRKDPLAGTVPETEAGIKVQDGSGVLIRSNTVAHRSHSNGGWGIFVTMSDDVQLVSNFVHSNEAGGLGVHASDDALIESNSIGTNEDGTASLPNGTNGLRLNASNNARISGNHIVGGDGCAILIDVMDTTTGHHPRKNTLVNNTIGTDWQRSQSLGPGCIQLLNAIDTTIGGEEEGNANLFGAMFLTNSTGTKIVGNFIGTKADGSSLEGDTNQDLLAGVNVTSSSGNTIAGNTIAYRNADGIYFKESDENIVRQNRIYSNGYRGILVDSGRENTITQNEIWFNKDLGIDLGRDGVTPNDLGPGPVDADEGANDLLNYPEVVQALKVDDDFQIIFAADVLAPEAGPYVVEVFLNDVCSTTPPFHGEAHHFLGSATHPGTPALSYRITPDVAIPNKYITATATVGGNTSEFSRCVKVVEAVNASQAEFDPSANGVVTDANGVQVVATGQEAQAKTAQTATLYTSRYNEQPETNMFSGSSARSDDATAVIPASTLSRYYYLATSGLNTPLTYDLCLDATDLTDDATLAGLVLVQRTEQTGGLWVPHDTHIEAQGSTRFVCADGLTSFGEFSFGTGSEAVLALPVLSTPEDGATEIDLGASFSWEAVPEAAGYDFQVALDPAFSLLLADAGGIVATTTSPDSLARSRLHYWRVRGVTAAGEAGPWSVPFRFTTADMSVDVEDETAVPESFVLEANYPNPFNPQTTIGFALPQASAVRLVVYDMLGREVARLVEGTMSAGRHEVIFDAASLPTGVYLYRLEANGFVQTRRMLLVK